MSTITVIKTGFSIAMRHLAKHHRVSLSFAHEVTSCEHNASIEHVATTLQKGDLLTKALVRVSFERGLDLNGIVCLSKTKSSLPIPGMSGIQQPSVRQCFSVTQIRLHCEKPSVALPHDTFHMHIASRHVTCPRPGTAPANEGSVEIHALT